MKDETGSVTFRTFREVLTRYEDRFALATFGTSLFQVLISCLEESDALLPGQFPGEAKGTA